ncbi:TIGR04104 family putative zinc finger protein [Pseudogracilibacillus sp. SO30301A]|uniref:TIGR04104 family putative zinc finger protein n=1 Tax=Pseudogracilibacillus sp. SO30301A TaxID=3098291 RepID=UPI003FA7C908
MKSLPTCQHCKMQWTYTESLKSLFRLRCPYCGEKNFARKQRPRDIIFSVVSMIIILFIFPFLNFTFLWKTVLVFIALAIYIATYPINLKLTKDEEPIF